MEVQSQCLAASQVLTLHHQRKSEPSIHNRMLSVHCLPNTVEFIIYDEIVQEYTKEYIEK